MFCDHRPRYFFLKIKAERSNAHHMTKAIVKQTGDASISITIKLPVALVFFHLFHYYCCYCNNVVPILSEITSKFVNVVCNHSDCINILGFNYKWLLRYLYRE